MKKILALVAFPVILFVLFVFATDGTGVGWFPERRKVNFKDSTYFSKPPTYAAGTTLEGVVLADSGDVYITPFGLNEDADKIVAWQALGSDAVALPVGMSSFGAAHAALVEGVVHGVAFYVPETVTTTGVHWLQYTQGNYTADKYNGFGLYSLGAGGALTKIDSTVNDGNVWKAASTTRGDATWLAGTHVLTTGVYYVKLLYNQSAEVTPPDIRRVIADNVTNLIFATTNVNYGIINSQSSVTQTPYNTSAMTSGTAADCPAIWLY